MTSIHPKNAHELLLYRILHRANLLEYFDNFLTQGGDDIQQLCEAGEDEFLEIMTLVGMSSKPLHVRRLQKALQEFYTNPDIYEQSETEFKSPSINENTSQSYTSHSTPNPLQTSQSPHKSLLMNDDNDNLNISSLSNIYNINSTRSPKPIDLDINNSNITINSNMNFDNSQISTTISKIINRDNLINMNPLQNICPPTQIYSNNKILNYDGLPTMVGYNNNNSLENFEHISQLESLLNYQNATKLNYTVSGSENKEYPNIDYMGINNPTAFTNNKINPDFFMNHSTLKSTLMDLGIDILSQPTTPPTRVHISGTERVKIRENAKALSESLPQFTAKPLNLKKPTNKEITDLLNCTNRDSKWEAKVRQYGAIYGRFDSKRKEKPMTLHELCVNEAAMQLCLYIPELLTRRDELFPLARQVVRNSGYQYAKGTKKSKSSHSKRPNTKNGEISSKDLHNSDDATKVKAEYESANKEAAAFKQGNYYGASGLHNPAAIFDVPPGGSTASAPNLIRYDYNYYANKMGGVAQGMAPASVTASKRGSSLLQTAAAVPFPGFATGPGSAPAHAHHPHHPLLPFKTGGATGGAVPPFHDDRAALAEFQHWAAAAAAANSSPRAVEMAAGHRRMSEITADQHSHHVNQQQQQLQLHQHHHQRLLAASHQQQQQQQQLPHHSSPFPTGGGPGSEGGGTGPTTPVGGGGSSAGATKRSKQSPTPPPSATAPLSGSSGGAASNGEQQQQPPFPKKCRHTL